MDYLGILKIFFLIFINNCVTGEQNCYSIPYIPSPEHTGVYPQNYNADEVARRINNWRRGDKHNVEEYTNLFDGDIMLTENQLRANILPTSKIWVRAEMPFYITTEHFTERQIAYIRSTMDIITNHTGFKFRRYCFKKDLNYAVFESANTGCWSYVGMLEYGQVINLQIPNCLYRGTMIHVLLHALGFHHQHNSPVRDNWLSVKWENIVSMHKHYYKTVDSETARDSGVLYDYDSIMHGGPYLHSFNDKPTMETQIPNMKIGQREAFSLRDVERVRRVYEEEVKQWLSLDDLPDINYTRPTTHITEITSVTTVSSITDTSEITSTDDSVRDSIPTAEVIISTKFVSDETTFHNTETTTFSTSEKPLTTEPPDAEGESTTPDYDTEEPSSTSDDDEEREETTDMGKLETTEDAYTTETTEDDYIPETTEEEYTEYTPETTPESEDELTTDETEHKTVTQSTTVADKRILNVFCLIWPYTINETCVT